MDLLKALSPRPGLRVQSGRMKVISENIANADSTRDAPGLDLTAGRSPPPGQLDRELGVRLWSSAASRPTHRPRTRIEPGHPAANANGEVRLPNVNSLIETMDMREAQRSYEANLNVIASRAAMISRTIEILRA